MRDKSVPPTGARDKSVPPTDQLSCGEPLLHHSASTRCLTLINHICWPYSNDPATIASITPSDIPLMKTPLKTFMAVWSASRRSMWLYNSFIALCRPSTDVTMVETTLADVAPPLSCPVNTLVPSASGLRPSVSL